MNYKQFVPTYRTRHLTTIKTLKKASKEKPILRMLNVGCGEGEYDSHLAKFSKKLECIDINKGDVEHAKAMNKKAKNITYSVQNAEKLKFKNNTFDFIVCLDMLECVANPHKVVKEIARVLKKGGRAILSIPSYHFPITYDPINYFAPATIPLGAYGFGHTRLLPNKELKQMFAKNGLRVRKVRRLSKYLIGLMELYWISFLQKFLKGNATNKPSDVNDSRILQPDGKVPALAHVLDPFIALDAALFSPSKKSVGLFFLLEKAS